ncbi:copia protein, partial [Gymnopus androsaceus JB14]
MLHSSALPKTLWAEAACHAVWVLNCTLTNSLGGKTPLEAVTRKKPDLRGLHEWGDKVWVHLEKGDKLGGRVKEGQWIGVSEKNKGFQ